MLPFKKHRKNKATIPDKTSLVIANKWKAFKQKLAIYLQEKSELLSAQGKKYSLIFFCFLFGGSSVAIVMHAITTKEETVRVAKISKPAHTNNNEQSILQPDSIITKREYDHVLQFKNYMLALRSDSAGSKKFDSIMQSRPQLMDSITLFEKMYLSQNKK